MKLKEEQNALIDFDTSKRSELIIRMAFPRATPKDETIPEEVAQFLMNSNQYIETRVDFGGAILDNIEFPLFKWDNVPNLIRSAFDKKEGIRVSTGAAWSKGLSKVLLEFDK